MNNIPIEYQSYLVQFFHPDKMLSWFSASVNAEDTTAHIHDMDLDTWLKIKTALSDNAQKAAVELLDEPDFARLVDQLPFKPGSKIIGLGDSITDDYQSWFEILRALLKIRRPHDEISLLNFGISGDTTSQIVSRFLPVALENPDWILCLAGTNDARLHGAFEPETLLSPEETARNIRILSKLKETQTKAQWIWITPPSVDEERVKSHWFFVLCQALFRNADIAVIADLIKDRPEPVIDIRGLFEASQQQDLLLEDGVHPSLEGHKVITRAVVEFLSRAQALP